MLEFLDLTNWFEKIKDLADLFTDEFIIYGLLFLFLLSPLLFILKLSKASKKETFLCVLGGIPVAALMVAILVLIFESRLASYLIPVFLVGLIYFGVSGLRPRNPENASQVKVLTWSVINYLVIIAFVYILLLMGAASR